MEGERTREEGEKWRHKLSHPAVSSFHSSSGTYASLGCLKERPAFPHHLNRLVPLPFHSLEGSPTKPTSLTPFSSLFLLHIVLIVSTRAEIKLSNGSFASASGLLPPPPPHPPPIILRSPPALLLCSFTHLGQTHHPPTA